MSHMYKMLLLEGTYNDALLRTKNDCLDIVFSIEIGVRRHQQ